MSWKLSKIKLSNFKFFHDPFAIDLDCKNLLIYGENGSGKSSIYWALYTIFQSIRKSPDEAKKYFLAGNESNLRNKFSLPSDHSKIELAFEDRQPSPCPNSTRSYTLSDTNVIDTSTDGGFFRLIEISSDFLNYKNLSAITDFKNSQNNEIFPIIISEILPYANFRTGYIDIDGNLTNQLNAGEWWKYINEAVNLLPRQVRRRTQLARNSQQYIHYNDLLRSFVDELKFYLEEISRRANSILQNDFGIKNVILSFVSDNQIRFDIPREINGRRGDNKLHKYNVYLHATVKNDNIPNSQHLADIIHLKTYFNEARLTCIGLAIRLAVLESKGQVGEVSLVFIDDMLISLDMSFRMPIIKKLLSYSNNGYQLCIFTHDRGFYNLIRSMLSANGDTDKWVKYEMLAPLIQSSSEEPKPQMIKAVSTYCEKAKIYLAAGDYAASANYLRKYGEEMLKSLLPSNMQYRFKNDGTPERFMLKTLYTKSQSSEFKNLYGFNTQELPDIEQYLDRLMNPLSHDDKDTPIFRKEIESAISEVTKYEDIVKNKKIICSSQEAADKRYEMKDPSSSSSFDIEFRPTEQWDFFQLPAGIKIKNCEIEIMSSTVTNFQTNQRFKLNVLWDNIKQQYHLNVTSEKIDYIFSNGQSLRSILQNL